MIHFGTGGWRDIIGDNYTKDNLELLAAAMADKMIAEHATDQGIVIGYDRRFLSKESMQWMACVFAAKGIHTLLINKSCPTPVAMYYTMVHELPYGMMVTASHNPATYNGVKVFTKGGRDADMDVTRDIEGYAERIDTEVRAAIAGIPDSDHYESDVRAARAAIIPALHYDDGIWDAWADENGTIGKAYGYQIGELARCKEVTAEGLRRAFGDDLSGKTIRQDEHGIYLLDQMDHVIYQLVNDPASRRIIANMYNVNEIADMALAPCAYSMTFNVSYKEGHDRPILSAMLNQRSQDMLTANNWNTVQYSLLTYALAQAYGFEPGEFIHIIGSAHIYDRHIPIIQRLIEQPQYDAPILHVNQEIKNFYDYDKNNAFQVENYRYNEFGDTIEVAV